MKQIKKTLSIFMSALFIMSGILNNVPVKAAVVNLVTPKINYIGVDHSPLVVGDTEKFTVTSKYDGEVQYRAFLFDGKTWSELTNGYGAPVDAKTPYVLPETRPFKLGKYKLSVWVKRAGEIGISSSKNYDAYYTADLNCVTRDSANRVYANGAAKVETNGLTVKINEIENIGGIEGPYLYRLFIFNPTTGIWTNGAKEYTESPSFTFDEAGTYVVIMHVNTAASTTWKNYEAGKVKGAYEAWKTVVVTVKNEEIVKVFDTSVKATNFGSTVNVTLTTDGVKHFPAASKYQILDGTNELSAVTSLGASTTVFPAKATGDNVNVKLFDANAKEVKDIEVLLGQSGTITVTPPLAFTSVKAINAKQIEIKFNTAVNRECAENVDNYKITGPDGTIMYIKKVVFLNSTTVRATLDFNHLSSDRDNGGTDIALKNGSSYKLTVSKYLLDASGNEQIADLISNFKFTDTTNPAIISASYENVAMGGKLVFNEPIKWIPDGYVFTLKLLDKNGIPTGPNLLSAGSMLDGPYARWANDEHSAIKFGTYEGGRVMHDGSRYRLSFSNTFADYTGHKLPLKSIDITYIANKDTTSPKVLSTKVIIQKYVEVTFDKPIGSYPLTNFYWNTDGAESNNGNIATGIFQVKATTYRLVFDNLMLEGNNFLFVKGNMNYIDNTTPLSKHPITVKAGLSPVVTGVVMNSKKQIKVKYNVDVDSLDTSFYSLVNPSALAVGISDIEHGVKSDGTTPDKSVKIINLSSDLKGGINTLTVSGLKDSLGRVIATHTQSLSVAKTLTGMKGVAYSDASNDTLVVSFGEALYGARDASKWLITTKLGYKPLNEIQGGTFVDGTSSNVFVIKLPQGTLPETGNSVQFGKANNVYDNYNNVVEPVTINMGNLQTSKPVDLSAAYYATILGKRTVAIALDNYLLNNYLLNNVKLSDFVLKADGVMQKINYIEVGNDYTGVTAAGTVAPHERSTISLFLDKDVDTSKEYILSTVAAPESTDFLGSKFLGNKSVVLTVGMLNTIDNVFAQGDDLNLVLKDSATTILPVKSDFSIKSVDGTSVTVNSVGESTFRDKKSIVLHTSGLTSGTAYVVNLKDNALTTVDGKSLESGDYLTTPLLTATAMYVGGGLSATTIDGDEYVLITFSDMIDHRTIIDLWGGKINEENTIALKATDGGSEEPDTLSLGNVGIITFSGDEITSSGAMVGTVSMPSLNQIKVKLGTSATTAKFSPVVNGTMTYNVGPGLASYYAPVDRNSSITKPASSFLSAK